MGLRILTCIIILTVSAAINIMAADSAKKPNILWLVSEDNTILLGCYGDKHARTPTLDQLAADGIRYDQARAPAPVCAATRTAIITAHYAPALGTQNMRSKEPLPEGIIYWTELLRKNGYYCTNNAKTDYNTKSDRVKLAWDESSNKAHYKNRPDGAPFFAIFNTAISHESCVHKSAKLTTDPATVEVQPYLPDTPAVRHDIAQYIDKVAQMDEYMKKMLDELEKSGLADDTIVFYYADHGGVLPRSKRFLYANGTQVPLIVRYGKNFAHLAPQEKGTGNSELVSLLDMPKTALSLAGVKPLPDMHGRAIAGEFKEPPRPFDYSYRDRMDEIYDCSRSTTDGKLLYIRHYMPQVPSGMHLDYLWKQPAMRNWAELFAAGKTTPVQSAFFLPKPAEELFDITADWHCINNLAANPAHAADMKRLREAHHAHMLRIRDTGLMPEPLMASLSGLTPPGTYAASDDNYPIGKLIPLVDRMQLDGDVAAMALALKDSNAAVRLWAVIASQQLTSLPAELDIAGALADPQMMVRVAAVEALLRRGDNEAAKKTLNAILNDADVWQVRLAALNVIARLKLKDAFVDAINAAKGKDKTDYIQRLSSNLLENKYQ